ncbi:WLM domain-containing protein [Mycena sp. CBHHK59/15]|nr:WLM domain-containing protein [Mycena sp. CBHHK59/15]
MSKTFVKSFTHLKGRPKAERALPMLQRIASLVKPIMRKHSWVLPVLSEFFPAQDNLIDVNGGQKILLRLRPAHAPDTFYDEEEVVQTMLHELTHNVHGPHDDKFYKFLAGLQDEYDALQRSGYAGEGFFSKGQRLGTNVSHDLPPHLARVKALEAAEKRRKASSVLGHGGRLGGRIDATNLTPRERAARAAERRARDEKACGSGELAQREADKAAKESIEHKVIDLTLDSDSDDGADSDAIIVDAPLAAGPSKLAIPHSKQVTLSTALRPGPLRLNNTGPLSSKSSAPRSHAKPYPAASKKVSSAEWTCRMCTLQNAPLALQCDACLSERPLDDQIGWACLACGETSMPHDLWTCRFCGTMKTTS